MKKSTIILSLAIIAFTAFSANAQNFGISFTRGASGIYPNHYQFGKTHSQGVSLGFQHAAKLKYQLHLQTGLNLSALASTKSITTRGNVVVAVPDLFYYVDVPLLLEKRVDLKDKSATSPHLVLLGGVNAAFLWHDKSYKDIADVAQRTNPVNPGITIGAMYAMPQSKHATFSVGPMVKVLGTGGSFSKAAGYYALRLDWRFIN